MTHTAILRGHTSISNVNYLQLESIFISHHKIYWPSPQNLMVHIYVHSEQRQKTSVRKNDVSTYKKPKLTHTYVYTFAIQCYKHDTFKAISTIWRCDMEQHEFLFISISRRRFAFLRSVSMRFYFSRSYPIMRLLRDKHRLGIVLAAKKSNVFEYYKGIVDANGTGKTGAGQNDSSTQMEANDLDNGIQSSSIESLQKEYSRKKIKHNKKKLKFHDKVQREKQRKFAKSVESIREQPKNGGIPRNKRQVYHEPMRTSPIICELNIFCNLFTRRPMHPIGNGYQTQQQVNNFWRLFTFPFVRFNPFNPHWSSMDHQTGYSPMIPAWSMFLPFYPQPRPPYGHYGQVGEGIPMFGYGGVTGVPNGGEGQMDGSSGSNHMGGSAGSNSQMGQNSGGNSNSQGSRPSPGNGKPPPGNRPGENQSTKPEQITQRPGGSPAPTPPNLMTTTERSYQTTYPPGMDRRPATTGRTPVTTMRQSMETTTKCNKTKNQDDKSSGGMTNSNGQGNKPSSGNSRPQSGNRPGESGSMSLVGTNKADNITIDRNLTNQWLSNGLDRLKEKWANATSSTAGFGNELNKAKDKWNNVTSAIGTNGNGQVGLTGSFGRPQADWDGGEESSGSQSNKNRDPDKLNYPGHGKYPWNPVETTGGANRYPSNGGSSGFPSNGVSNGYHDNSVPRNGLIGGHVMFLSDLFYLPSQFNFTGASRVPLWWNITHYEPGFGEGLFVSTTSVSPNAKGGQRGGSM